MISSEQKLQLIQQVRSKYQEDRADLSRREQVLYGASSYADAPLSGTNENECGNTNLIAANNSLMFRWMIAFFMVILVILMDVGGNRIGILDSNMIFKAISQDQMTSLAKICSNFLSF